MQDRSINGLHLKMKAGLLSAANIVDDYVDLPGILLVWINDNKNRADRSVVAKVLALLTTLAQVYRRHSRTLEEAKCFPAMDRLSF